jgi:hypothetical protein
MGIAPAGSRIAGTPWPRDLIAKMVADGLIASEKQAHATLEKWARKGWYEYGTSLDLGWLTKLGAEQLSK